MVALLELRWLRSGSAERERESFHARVEKLDFELTIGDRLLLPDQLIKPLLAHRAVALPPHLRPNAFSASQNGSSCAISPIKPGELNFLIGHFAAVFWTAKAVGGACPIKKS
jgi:hypothetical protein